MRRTIVLIWFVLCVVFVGCKDNVVCPAFQSTYILNDSVRWARYSLFENDSTPKMAMASRRTKYGVNKKTSLFRKNYELMTAPKVNVLGNPAPDPAYYREEVDVIAMELASNDSLQLAAGDSLGMDSTMVLADASEAFPVTDDDGPKYKYRYHPHNPYNQEQEYYNKYFGELLVDNRPPPPTPEQLAQQMLEEGWEADSLGLEEEKKGLFKKKKKQAPSDSLEVDPETLQQVIDQEETTDPVPPAEQPADESND